MKQYLSFMRNEYKPTKSRLTLSARRGLPIFSTADANASVGPFQRSCSTSSNSGASVRSVARFLKSSARSRFSSEHARRETARCGRAGR